jgi:chaperonin GroES
VTTETASTAAAQDAVTEPSPEPSTPPATEAAPPRPSSTMGRTDKMPIKMLNDRILVRMAGSEGERRSGGGILIPATAQMGKRLTWAEVVAVGPNVRAVEEGDQVLFNPEDRYEVEVRGEDLIILRERDIHAVAAPRLAEGSTGLYL